MSGRLDTYMKLPTISLVIATSILLVGCASKPHGYCKPLPTLTAVEEEQLRQARDLSLAKLKTYRVRVTTREEFLSDWRFLQLTEPTGNIGIGSYELKRDPYRNGKVIQSVFILEYYNSPFWTLTRVCTLTFDEQEVLKSLDWNKKP